MSSNIIWLHELGINDVDKVGGKNASLGEMIDAPATLIFNVDFKGHEVRSFQASHGVAGGTMDRYEQHFATEDPVGHAWRAQKAGTVLPAQALGGRIGRDQLGMTLFQFLQFT